MMCIAITALIALIVGCSVGFGFGFWTGAAWQNSITEMQHGQGLDRATQRQSNSRYTATD